MPFMYGAADEKFVRLEKPKRRHIQYRFALNEELRYKPKLNKNSLSVLHQKTPDTLVNLALKQINEIPLSQVFDWTSQQCCAWIASYGYPQYRETFRINMVIGRKLILLDANGLQAMNIRDFDHIMHIVKGIQTLFEYALVNFASVHALNAKNIMTAYQLFRTQTGGLAHQMTTRGDLWRQMQIIAKEAPEQTHWDKLAQYLHLVQPPYTYTVRVGAHHRYNMHKCTRIVSPTPEIEYLNCTCTPPCTCGWTKLHMRKPGILKCLTDAKMHTADDLQFKESCDACKPPPCDCGWTWSRYLFGKTLTCLQNAAPQKYGGPYRRPTTTLSTHTIHGTHMKSFLAN